MAREFPEDKLTILIHEYRKKLGDFPPRHALHDPDPEAVLRAAIKDGKLIPENAPGNTDRDSQ